jgi:hypothetical protein
VTSLVNAVLLSAAASYCVSQGVLSEPPTLAPMRGGRVAEGGGLLNLAP